MATVDEITQIFGVMSKAYPKYEIDAQTVELYTMMLHDLPADILEAAAKEIIISSNFFPSIAEWRSKSIDLMTGIIKIPTAAEAWQEAIEHCRRGKYEDYSHPLVEKAVLTIGIQYWKAMTTDEEMATRAQFLRIYDSLLKRAQDDLKMLPESKKITEKYQISAGRIRALESGKSCQKQ